MLQRRYIAELLGWGVSYGTFIGESFANMFPQRIGRVALDGVLDPDEWTIQSGLNQSPTPTTPRHFLHIL
jgi:pimeloyl-ACP methyl ester carboxylesterase